MQELINLVENNQSFLIKRALEYAKVQGYTKYTSTLEEAWVASISGLSKALIDAISHDYKVPEIEVDHDFSNNPISSFGVIEAQRHRHRGVSLEMFLGLMKYYRQAYLDLITESIQEIHRQRLYLLCVNRFFDHNEIAFASEWTDNSKETIISELQATNRIITNEKNKYLTIFESMYIPAILLNAENQCININYSAQQLLQENIHSSGYLYYADLPTYPEFNEILPWLTKEFADFYSSNKTKTSIEKEFQSQTQGKRNLIVKFHKMLDVSSKFEGTVVSFTDMTEYKKIEEQLRHLSFHDALTGLYNRSYMEEQMIRIRTDSLNPVGFISIDVDGLKLVNDNLGHHAGDTLLINVSQILKKCFRESDAIIRTGGDEFLIIMPLSDSAAVQKACKRIHEKINSHNCINLSMPISISIGWSVGDLCIDSNIRKLIKEADNRMYIDKQTNRLKYATFFKERLDKFGDKLF